MRPITSPRRVLACTTSMLTTSSTSSMRILPFPPSTLTFPMATLPASLARSQLRGASRRSRSVHPSGAARLPSNPPSTLQSLRLRVTWPTHSPTSILTHFRPLVLSPGSEHTLRLVTPPSLCTSRKLTAVATQASPMIAAAPILMVMPMSTLTRKHHHIHTLYFLETHFISSYGVMYFCGAYWSAPTTGTNSKVCFRCSSRHIAITYHDSQPGTTSVF